MALSIFDNERCNLTDTKKKVPIEHKLGFTTIMQSIYATTSLYNSMRHVRHGHICYQNRGRVPRCIIIIISM